MLIAPKYRVALPWRIKNIRCHFLVHIRRAKITTVSVVIFWRYLNLATVNAAHIDAMLIGPRAFAGDEFLEAGRFRSHGYFTVASERRFERRQSPLQRLLLAQKPSAVVN